MWVSQVINATCWTLSQGNEFTANCTSISKPIEIEVPDALSSTLNYPVYQLRFFNFKMEF